MATLTFVAAGPSGSRAAAPALTSYSGLGTWIDVYSAAVRADPDEVVAALASRHVKTVFVETGNFRRRVDVVRPRWLGRLIEAAHAHGIDVVGWYLPALVNQALDLRRARAAIQFRTPGGERFDSFALDIESSAVRGAAERNRRLLALSARLRAAVGANYPLGAIIPSPVGMKLLPRYWPGFPYAALARTYDVLLPMAYFTYRARGSEAVARYVQTSVRVIRSESGNPTIPIHVIGGLAAKLGNRDAAAFVRAVASCGVQGFSLYEFSATKPSVWQLLRSAPVVAPRAPRC